MINRLATSLAFLLAGGLAFGADIGEYDIDSSGDISRSEYDSYIREGGAYGNWDLNDDGYIEETEYDELNFDDDFADWDLDDNDLLDSGEFSEGVFGYFDDDESGHWDGDEWDDAGEAGIFDM